MLGDGSYNPIQAFVNNIAKFHINQTILDIKQIPYLLTNAHIKFWFQNNNKMLPNYQHLNEYIKGRLVFIPKFYMIIVPMSTLMKSI